MEKVEAWASRFLLILVVGFAGYFLWMGHSLSSAFSGALQGIKTELDRAKEERKRMADVLAAQEAGRRAGHDVDVARSNVAATAPLATLDADSALSLYDSLRTNQLPTTR